MGLIMMQTMYELDDEPAWVGDESAESVDEGTSCPSVPVDEVDVV